MEKAGGWRIWTARRDGELIGFIQWCFFSPLGFTGVAFAADQGWYFSPDERNGPWQALTMWREAETALRALGVEIMQSHENTLLPLKSFFRRLGMTPIAVVHQKDIAR